MVASGRALAHLLLMSRSFSEGHRIWTDRLRFRKYRSRKKQNWSTIGIDKRPGWWLWELGFGSSFLLIEMRVKRLPAQSRVLLKNRAHHSGVSVFNPPSLPNVSKNLLLFSRVLFPRKILQLVVRLFSLFLSGVTEAFPVEPACLDYGTPPRCQRRTQVAS